MTAEDTDHRAPGVCQRCGLVVGQGAGFHAEIFRFADFELDAETRELRRAGREISLQPLACRLLVLLLENDRRVVTRAEAERALWSRDSLIDTCQSLNCLVRKIRKCLGESGSCPHLVRTVPRRGWIFTQPVVALPRDSPKAESAPTRARPRAEVHIAALIVGPQLADDAAVDWFLNAIAKAVGNATFVVAPPKLCIGAKPPLLASGENGNGAPKSGLNQARRRGRK